MSPLLARLSRSMYESKPTTGRLASQQWPLTGAVIAQNGAHGDEPAQGASIGDVADGGSGQPWHLAAAGPVHAAAGRRVGGARTHRHQHQGSALALLSSANRISWPNASACLHLLFGFVFPFGRAGNSRFLAPWSTFSTGRPVAAFLSTLPRFSGRINASRTLIETKGMCCGGNMTFHADKHL